jgi:hypothetical protein
MKRWNRVQEAPHIVPAELRCNLGHNNTIFICSGTDLFAEDVTVDLPCSVFNRASEFPDNTYIFQSKNPHKIIPFLNLLSAGKYKFCTTIETNRHYPEIMCDSPFTNIRAIGLKNLHDRGFETMITIEPIMDFDLTKMLRIIHMAEPAQVNIGADSGNNHLPEPPKEKVIELILELQKFTTVYQKKNFRRKTNGAV